MVSEVLKPVITMLPNGDILIVGVFRGVPENRVYEVCSVQLSLYP